MVNDETAKLIGYVKEGNKALIVLGDYCQLPPVNQETDSYSLKTFLQSLPYQCDFKVRCTLVNLIRTEIIKCVLVSFVKYH
jgi:hypothetical protein